jgi:hypothetical protein
MTVGDFVTALASIEMRKPNKDGPFSTRSSVRKAEGRVIG